MSLIVVWRPLLMRACVECEKGCMRVIPRLTDLHFDRPNAAILSHSHPRHAWSVAFHRQLDMSAAGPCGPLLVLDREPFAAKVGDKRG
jgi:hypothetical protein